MPSKAALARRQDKPILFSAPMVRALLREAREPGTGKTQTRRVLKPKRGVTILDCTVDAGPALGGMAQRLDLPLDLFQRPYAVGDRLWVREAHRLPLAADGPQGVVKYGPVFYEADQHWYLGYQTTPGRKRPGIHLPRWASRLTLLVTEVRVERLASISEADARAEGVEHDSDGWRDYLMPSTQCCGSASDSFYTLWNSLHGPDAWAANSFVAVLTLRPTLANIDAPPPEADPSREARS